MRKSILCFAAAAVCAFSGIFAPLSLQARADDAFPLLWEFGRGTSEMWSDGADVSTNYSNGWMQVTIDASKLDEKDYYSAHIYKTGVFNWSDYGEIFFHFHNPGSQPLKMNFVITDSEYNEHILTADMPVLVMRTGSEIKELIPEEWGAIEIPPEFRGEIHIPDYKITNNVLEKVISFGISFTVPKGTIQTFLMSNVRYISEEQSSPVYNFHIEGDINLQMPAVGESIAFYSVVFKDVDVQNAVSSKVNTNVAFSLDSDSDLNGISITEDGRLTVAANAHARYFTVFADVNGEVRSALPVTLTEHWSKTAPVENGMLLHLPRPDEVKGIKSEDNPLFDPRVLLSVRLFFIISSVVLCGLYFWWKKA